MKRCRHCNREKPDYGADLSCAKGGYCEWHSPDQVIHGITHPTSYPMDISWAPGNGQAGQRMMWSFPNTAIVEGLEVEVQGGTNYNGFIDSLRIGLVEYLAVGPYPILMWSGGMPPILFMLPSVPYGHHFGLETRGFYGKIRPRGIIIAP